MSKHATIPGYLYSVTTTTVCTVTDTSTEKLLCQAEDGAQGMFVAISNSVTCSDDAATIRQASTIKADIQYLVVPKLPDTGDEGIIYLLRKTDAQTQNIYEEWIWTNGAWEQLGPVNINLADYPTLADANIFTGANEFTGNVTKTTTTTELADTSVLNRIEMDARYTPLESVKASGMASLAADNPVAIGKATVAGTDNIGIGKEIGINSATANVIAIGTNIENSAAGSNSVAIGNLEDVVLSSNNIVLGTPSTLATNAISIGNNTSAPGYSTVIGQDAGNRFRQANNSGIISLTSGASTNKLAVNMEVNSFEDRHNEPLLTIARSNGTIHEIVTLTNEALYASLQNAKDYNYPAQPVKLLDICDSSGMLPLVSMEANKIYKICNVTGGVERTTLDFTNLNFAEQAYPEDALPTSELWITLTQGNAYTLVWPSAMLWPGDEVPYMQSPKANTDTTEQDAITYVVTIRKNAVYINGTVATALAGNLAYYFKNTVSL